VKTLERLLAYSLSPLNSPRPHDIIIIHCFSGDYCDYEDPFDIP
jgi:hypothetical protein